MLTVCHAKSPHSALNWNGSKLKLDGKYWVVKPDPDGQTLTLEYTAGTYFILR